MPYDGFNHLDPDTINPDHKFNKLLIYNEINTYLGPRVKFSMSDIAKEFGPGFYNIRYMTNNGPKFTFEISEFFAKESGFNKKPPIEDKTEAQRAPDHLGAPQINPFEIMQQSQAMLMQVVMAAIAGNQNNAPAIDPKTYADLIQSGQAMGLNSSSEHLKTLMAAKDRLELENTELRARINDLIQENADLKGGLLGDMELEEPDEPDSLGGVMKMILPLLMQSNSLPAATTAATEQAKPQELNKIESFNAMSAQDQIKQIIVAGFREQLPAQGVANAIINILNENPDIKTLLDMVPKTKAVDYVYTQLNQDNPDLKKYVSDIMAEVKK